MNDERDRKKSERKITEINQSYNLGTLQKAEHSQIMKMKTVNDLHVVNTYKEGISTQLTIEK